MKHKALIVIGLLLAGNGLQAQDANFSPLNLGASDYEIQPVKSLNSQHLDFYAVPYKDGVVFTSSRQSGNIFHCNRDFVNGHYLDLYFAKSDGAGEYLTPEMLRGDLNGRYHDGVATFSKDGNHMIFSRNNFEGPNDKGNVHLKVYEASLERDNWLQVKELSFNDNYFSTCHPSLSADGKWLYFASNRPGGYGGMDLYVAQKAGDGWGAPINLGAAVNSKGNEIFPFIAPGNILYFASDGLPGMGGLDVFSIQMDGAITGERTHLPAPVNSPEDDFAFTSNETGNKGFFSSDRTGGKGQDDIYEWNFKGVRPVIANICVVEKGTNERIEDANLIIEPLKEAWSGAQPAGQTAGDVTWVQMQALNQQGKQFLVLVPYQPGQPNALPASQASGKSCQLKVPVKPGTNYKIRVSKPGFRDVEMIVSGDQMAELPEFLVPIERPLQQAIAFQGTVIDKSNDTPVPEASVKVRNLCTGQRKEFTADSNGDFNFPMDCNCDYEIVATKGNYKYDYKTLHSNEIPCERSDYIVMLYLEPLLENRLPASPSVPTFEVGTVIRLDKLYYDYDKYNIRPDAAAELDKVVYWMKKYPSLEIELGSHTDARGSDEYNRILAQQRADAAVKYIISQGIPASRIRAAGYGESQLTNGCGNDVECQEAEHQQNRRTEIKVTRFDEDGVLIQD
jgi:outer membrane protein OmpA-like peptidoglycan-associated protein